MLKRIFVAVLALGLVAFLAGAVDAGHNYSASHNPNVCGECHNVEHAGNQDAKTIFPGSPWLYIGGEEYDVTGDWTDYTSYTILSTPSIYNTYTSRVCLKCHGKSSFKEHAYIGYIYIDPNGHYGHPIGMEITDSLLTQRATRLPEVMQDQMTTLSEMRDTFWFDGPDRNIMACATCHGYIHDGDKGPYEHFLTLPMHDEHTGLGGELCGACHTGKWLSLTQQG